MEIEHRAEGAARNWAVLYSVLFLPAVFLLLAACSAAVQPAASAAASGAAQPTAEQTAAATSAGESSVSNQNEQPEYSASFVEPTGIQTGALPVTSSNPKQEVLDAIKAFQQAGPYRAHTAVTSGSRTIENIAEVVPPDRFHIVSSGQEMMIVGSNSYIRQKDRWITYMVDVSGITSGLRGAFNEETIRAIQDVRIIGSETVGGNPATVYQFKALTASSGKKVTSTVRVWINTSNRLPLKQEIDGELNGLKTHTVQEIQYDPKIKIDPPVH